MVIIMVLARPSRSPRTPKKTPPMAHPTMKMAVAQAACLSTAAFEAPPPSNSRMAGLRARLKSCWAMVSNIQPMLATLNTNQWYPFSSRYQAYFGSDMKLLFYIAALHNGAHAVPGLERDVRRQRHRVAIQKPFHHLHRGYARSAFLDGAALQGVALQREDVVALLVVAQRFFGNHQRILYDGGADFGVHVGAGDQFAAGVLDDADYFSYLPRSQCLNGNGLFLNRAVPLLSGQGVPGDGDGLALGDAAQFRFIHVYTDAQLIE